MEQKNEIYERLDLTITEFDSEDVICTSEVYHNREEYEKFLTPKTMPFSRF